MRLFETSVVAINAVAGSYLLYKGIDVGSTATIVVSAVSLATSAAVFLVRRRPPEDKPRCLDCGAHVSFRRRKMVPSCNLDLPDAAGLALQELHYGAKADGKNRQRSYSIVRTKHGRRKHDGLAMSVDPTIVRITSCRCGAPQLWTVGGKQAATMMSIRDHEYVHPATCN